MPIPWFPKGTHMLNPRVSKQRREPIWRASMPPTLQTLEEGTACSFGTDTNSVVMHCFVRQLHLFLSLVINSLHEPCFVQQRGYETGRRTPCPAIRYFLRYVIFVFLPCGMTCAMSRRSPLARLLTMLTVTIHLTQRVYVTTRR